MGRLGPADRLAGHDLVVDGLVGFAENCMAEQSGMHNFCNEQLQQFFVNEIIVSVSHVNNILNL